MPHLHKKFFVGEISVGVIPFPVCAVEINLACRQKHPLNGQHGETFGHLPVPELFVLSA